MKGYKQLLNKAGSYLHQSEKLFRKSRRSNANSMVMMFAGFAAGLVAGAALGLLFAPRTGRETRQAIGTTAKDLGTTVADRARQGADRLTSLKDQAVDTVKSKLGSDTTGNQAVPAV